MKELIVRLARAIASRPRLIILSHLARKGEAFPSELGQLMGLPLSVLSFHLRTLVVSGLVSMRRSGAVCHYSLQSPYPTHTLSGETSRWLRTLLQPGKGPPIRGRDTGATARSKEAKDKDVHALLFDAATAFTDVRRLQILGTLHTRRADERHALRQRLKMSPAAMCRHLSKLSRRGIIVATREGKAAPVYRISEPQKSPIHERLLEIVRKTLKASPRT